MAAAEGYGQEAGTVGTLVKGHSTVSPSQVSNILLLDLSLPPNVPAFSTVDSSSLCTTPEEEVNHTPAPFVFSEPSITGTDTDLLDSGSPCTPARPSFTIPVLLHGQEADPSSSGSGHHHSFPGLYNENPLDFIQSDFGKTPMDATQGTI